MARCFPEFRKKTGRQLFNNFLYSLVKLNFLLLKVNKWQFVTKNLLSSNFRKLIYLNHKFFALRLKLFWWHVKLSKFCKVLVCSESADGLEHYTARSYAGLMCPRPMCPRPKILGFCAPWTKPPLDVSLTDVSRPWTASTMKLAPAPNESVERLAGFAYAPDQVYWLAPLRRMHARPTHKTPIKSEFRDGMVRSGAK